MPTSPPGPDNAAFWDSRYAAPGRLFGDAPTPFVTAQAPRMPRGTDVLVPCDGDGRHAVWLAAQGYAVTAFDVSGVAVEQARAFAQQRGVTVQFHQAGIDDWDWTQPFGAVVCVYAQVVPPPRQGRMLEELGQAVRPGGLLLLHGYAPRQVGRGTGGPPSQAHMYTLPLLSAAYDGWHILHSDDYDRDLNEGSHTGPSALIDFVAQKPA